MALPMGGILACTALAGAAPLQFDPSDEPAVVATVPALGPDVVRVRFEHPRPVEAVALPAAVLALRAGVPVPPELEAEGEALGRSKRSWRVPGRPGETGVDVARRWAGHPAVETVIPDLLLSRTRRDFDDPRYPSQWYHERLGMDALFAVSLGDPDLRVAVIDSAIELSHPDLATAFVEPYDAFDDDDDPSPNPGEYCASSTTALCDEHGTAVSGIIGARADNGEGIVGFCSACQLVPIKMLGEGFGATSADVAAFEHAIDADAGVINNSWGFTESIPVPGPLAAVVRRATTEPRGGLGAVVVFAAGNDDRTIEDDELESMPEVLCVSATDIYGNPTAYTNRGDGVDVAAPSATFTTSVNGGYTETFGGTSAAAPVVSGMAAWVLSVDPSLSEAEVRALIVATAVPSPKVTHDETGHHPVYGYGELSATNLLSALVPDDVDTDTGEERRAACGCVTGSGAGWAWIAGIAALGLRRRRR